MNLRPRCREWLPLATQQLRLRNLVRIQGFNIDCKQAEDALIYYTLHSSKECAAFYMSETLPSRHFHQKWAEIICPEMLKSNGNCVCVKVWAQLTAATAASKPNTASPPRETENKLLQPKEPMSALTKQLTANSLMPPHLLRPPDDHLLFTWGVYFSGLIPLSQQSDIKFAANSLIFQLNGDYFAAPEHFTIDCLRQQLALNYQRYSNSLPKANISNSSNKLSINSPQVSRSSSPVKDWQHDLLGYSKTRYMQLSCTRTDVRHSYKLSKLLKLQKLQRDHLQEQREIQLLCADIKQISVHCITLQEAARKQRAISFSSSSTSPSSKHNQGMGRQLSVLLAEQQQIEPQTLLRAQQLQRRVETLRSKKRLLQNEHNTYCERIGKLREQLQSIQAERLDLQHWLEMRCEQLQNEKEDADQAVQLNMQLQEVKSDIEVNMKRRQSALCVELREIYPLARSSSGLHTICGVLFPNLDAFVGDGKSGSSVNAQEMSPMALSAALGYVAHLVQMIAVIINRPLRNPIIHEGSRSRIKDIVKELPPSSREFPLYTRSSFPSKMVKYAIYLLNQNIAQLYFDITGQRCHLRTPIDNILHIFAVLERFEQVQRNSELNSESAVFANNHLLQPLQFTTNNIKSCTNGDGNFLPTTDDCIDGLSKSHSSIDMQHVPVPLSLPPPKLSTLLQTPNSQPILIAERNKGGTQARVSRSVGSYSDCDDDVKQQTLHEHCYSNSDSNIQLQ